MAITVWGGRASSRAAKTHQTCCRNENTCIEQGYRLREQTDRGDPTPPNQRKRKTARVEGYVGQAAIPPSDGPQYAAWAPLMFFF